MKRTLIVVGMVFLGVLGGCKSNTSPNSKIVAEVEAAGSGDLDQLDGGAIQNWLASHSGVAEQIGPECGKKMKTATAEWQTTTEGRTCVADSKVLFFNSKHLTDGHY